MMPHAAHQITLTIPVLETGRLTLREPREADFPTMLTFNDSPRAGFVGGGAPRQHVWRNLLANIGHWVLRGHGFYSVETRAGDFIGSELLDQSFYQKVHRNLSRCVPPSSGTPRPAPFPADDPTPENIGLLESFLGRQRGSGWGGAEAPIRPRERNQPKAALPGQDALCFG